MATANEATQVANRSAVDPKRLVVIFYLVAALVIALFFDRILDLIFAQIGVGNRSIVEGLDWKISTLVGFVLAVGGAVAAWMHPKSHQVSMEVATELMKVTWPSWSETRVATGAVIITSLVAAVLLFGIDTLAYNLMVEWLPALWGKF